MPYKVNEKRRHRIPKARYRVQNWREYDAALRRRGDLTVWVTLRRWLLGHHLAPVVVADRRSTLRLRSRRA